ncbi:MAG: hypothetical protein AMXMBFR46_28960 [Acidimicrobiia bacterium]
MARGEPPRAHLAQHHPTFDRELFVEARPEALEERRARLRVDRGRAAEIERGLHATEHAPTLRGVERELQHAFEHGKEVYVVWKPKKNPSPFITETCTKIFPSVPEALAHFEAQGMFGEKNLFGH